MVLTVHSTTSRNTGVSFLLGEENLASSKIHQFLEILLEEYLKPLSPVTNDIDCLFSEDYCIEQLAGTLMCLIKHKTTELKNTLCIKIARQILVNYAGVDSYVMSDTTIRKPQNDDWLKIFHLCTNMLKTLIASDEDPALRIEALLLYSAFSELLQTLAPEPAEDKEAKKNELFSFLVINYRKSLPDNLDPYYLLLMIMNITNYAALQLKDPVNTKFYLEVLKEIQKEHPFLAKSFAQQLEILQNHCDKLLNISTETLDNSIIYD